MVSTRYRTGIPYHTDLGPVPGLYLNSDWNPNVNPDLDIHEKLKNSNLNLSEKHASMLSKLFNLILFPDVYFKNSP
jgi:hypothetical protein